MHKILVVDDDASLRLSVASALQESHFWVEQAKDGEEGINKVRSGKFDLVLMDVNMPKVSGLEALKEIKHHDPSIIVIILTAFSNVRDAVEATRNGAYNYLEKPVKADNLVYMVGRALKAHSIVKNVSLSAPVFKLPNGTDFIGQSSEMKKVFSVIDKLSQVDTVVLIRGESGTGKELVALSLHSLSPRKDNRFVTINCSAIPETLIESEFFGHEKGAFTGADSRKIGKFQYADGGTLFLDEIGDISPAMQVKLLRALQEKKFTPVGANREVEVNVRIVAATNRNLEEMIKSGDFREDLFYRLNVLPVVLPPLRERKNDIEHLIRYFIEKFNQQHKKNIQGVMPEAMEYLRNHSWPGNIRELENVIEHAFVIENSSLITSESLPAAVIHSEPIHRNGKLPNNGIGSNVKNSNPAAHSMGESIFDAKHRNSLVSGEILQVATHEVQNTKPITFAASSFGVNFIPSPLVFTQAEENLSQKSNTSSGLYVQSKDALEAQNIDEELKKEEDDVESDEDFSSNQGTPLLSPQLDFQASKEEFEKQFLINALKVFKGKINQTAIHANIPKKTLLRKLEKYQIRAKDYAPRKVDT